MREKERKSKERIKDILRNALDFKKSKTILGYAPRTGNVWNPLRKYPRNSPCICKSGKKFKKCCINKIPRVVTEKEAKSWTAYVQAVKR